MAEETRAAAPDPGHRVAAASREGPAVRWLLSLVVFLLATSCVVPPSCLSRRLGASAARNGHLATIIFFAEPVAELKRRYPAGVGMWERFERGGAITIDGRGGMTVSGQGSWPERCLRISPEDLAELSRHWAPFLAMTVSSRTTLQVMADPYTGDDWQASDHLLSLSFGSSSGKLVELLWDGHRSLPGELDTAVIGTLEVVCSNSRLAKRYLLRDLPRLAASRLDCSTD